MQMDIDLTPRQKAWLEAQVAAGRFTSVGEAVRDAVDRSVVDSADWPNAIGEGDALIDALEQGAASGVGTRTLDEIWQAATSKGADAGF